RTITSVYDDANRLTSMTENGRTTSYQYDLNGNITIKTLPNGDTESNSYDVLNRTTIQYITSSSSQTICRYAYTYDLAGNVLSIQETYPTTTSVSNRTVTNTYDGAYRLLTESNVYSGYNLAAPQPADYSTAYTYDTNNNRLTKTVSGGGAPTALTYTYNNLNQITQYGDGARQVSLTYDSNGNRIGRAITGSPDDGSDTYTYTYDRENRLVKLENTPTGATTPARTYSYAYL
ncbi:MAG TPA: RHS repeat domain-containing protein, partial [Candidatus Methylacidiphilales bacterium]|nr:RHS repeat domain-containing protein [Candidatus Methylacidiphilales bacterium]